MPPYDPRYWLSVVFVSEGRECALRFLVLCRDENIPSCTAHLAYCLKY
jgi:hypothetical protein